MRMRKFVPVLAISVVVLTQLAGCAGGATDNYSVTSNLQTASAEAPVMREESYILSDAEAVFDMAFSGAGVPGRDMQGVPGGASGADISGREQKIILEAELRMATDRFDEVSARIRGIAGESDGYVQNSEQYTAGEARRRFIITIRVPYEKYEAVFEQIKGLCVLISSSETQRNATAEYYDLQARHQTKLIEEERLIELIDRTEKIEDILKLESLLGEVRTQIEVYRTQMTSIDRLSSYSTINVYLDEVADETAVIIPANLSGKIYESFIQSVNSTIRFVQGILIFLVGISVQLFVILVATAIIWGLFRLRRFVKQAAPQLKGK